MWRMAAGLLFAMTTQSDARRPMGEGLMERFTLAGAILIVKCKQDITSSSPLVRICTARPPC